MDRQINDFYFDPALFSPLLDWIRREGSARLLEKNDYFVRQDERASHIGVLEEGICRFSRTDGKGREHVVGYTFAGSLVGEYTACLCARPSLVDIRAVTPCRLCLVPYERMRQWMETTPEGNRMGRLVA